MNDYKEFCNIQIGCKVVVIADCKNIISIYDLQTGDSDCPFEDTCNFEVCSNTNKRLFETIIVSIDKRNNDCLLSFKDLDIEFKIAEFGKTVFLVEDKYKAERILREL